MLKPWEVVAELERIEEDWKNDQMTINNTEKVEDINSTKKNNIYYI